MISNSELYGTADAEPNNAQQALKSSYTGSMPELLKKLGITLLVSTHQSNKLITVRENAGKVNTHFQAINKPMGITGNQSRFFVGTHNEIVDFHNIPSIAAKLAPAGRYDACFMPKRRVLTGDVDIHEMGIDRNNQLWFVNTRFSCLSTTDEFHSFVPQWRPPFITDYAGEDRCHLNGLAMDEGMPKYVTALAQTNTPEGWKENKKSSGVLMDVTTNKVVADNLAMPHSPRCHAGHVWFLESGKGSLSSVDTQNGNVKHAALLPGFTRGLAFAGEYAFVGLSKIRSSANAGDFDFMSQYPEEEHSCGVWVINVRSGEVAGFLRFDGTVQEISSVHIMHQTRFPEVLDFNSPLLNSSFVIPKEPSKQP